MGVWIEVGVWREVGVGVELDVDADGQSRRYDDPTAPAPSRSTMAPVKQSSVGFEPVSTRGVEVGMPLPIGRSRVRLRPGSGAEDDSGFRREVGRQAAVVLYQGVARSSALDDGIVIVGVSSHPVRDAYHSLLRMPWTGVLGIIAGLFLTANAVFAVLYAWSGGIYGAREGSLRDAFFFSAQTIGTVGYGAMYPTSTAANLLVVAESIVGVILTALVTGIVFARFSQTTSMLVFTSKVCISPMDGVPTLQLRVGNDRQSTIFEAMIRVVITRTAKTAEGVTFYRMIDLPLVRERSLALSRSWTVMHVIDENSPLWGLTPDSCEAEEVEITASVVGTDDTSLQPVHARRRYVASEVAWGARPADVLSERPDGLLLLDVRRFDDIVPTQPTAAFPYPKS